MELIGTVVGLQVQRSRLKPGSVPNRIYDPAPLLAVGELEIEPRGCRGLTADGPVLDVHHADHPATRNVKLGNGLSVMTRPRYEALRASYGSQLADGLAGESVLLDTEDGGLTGPLLLESDTGLMRLTGTPAPPCVEFSRFVTGRGPTDTGPEVLAALAALNGGARGFYLTTSDRGCIRLGHRLFRAAG